MYQNENYLMHHGVKGMKWGVRRFQNYDGTRIKALKSNLKAKANSPEAQRAFKPGKDNKPSPAEKITRSSKDAVNSAKGIVRATQKKKTFDTSDMTDDELRRRINRIELDRKYNRLMNEDLSPGRQRASDILDFAGDMLAIGASAAAIGTAVYQIRRK